LSLRLFSNKKFRAAPNPVLRTYGRVQDTYIGVLFHISALVVVGAGGGADELSASLEGSEVIAP
jgi:hypothetical protein